MASQLSQLSPAELSKMPSTSPPPGVIVDFDGPNPLKTTIVTVTSVFMGLAFLFVSIRLYTKIKISGKGSWDDLTCVIGLISTLVYWIVFLLEVVNEGFGRHLWNVPLIITLSEAFVKLAFISDWLHNVGFAFVKATFFILYWSIFRPFRWLKIGIIGGAVVVIGVYSGCTLASLIGVAPRPGGTWQEAALVSQNSPGQKLHVPLAAFGLVSDVFILLLPISGVLRLQLSPKKKFALVMIFMTGIGACICSSISLYYRTALNFRDVTYTTVNIQILIIVELCVGIIITCVPATSAFLHHVLPPTNTLHTKVSSFSKRFRSSFQSHASHGNISRKRRADSIDGPYRNLEDGAPVIGSKDQYDLGLYPTQGVKTNVVAEPLKDFHDDEIHLRLDLEQG